MEHEDFFAQQNIILDRILICERCFKKKPILKKLKGRLVCESCYIDIKNLVCMRCGSNNLEYQPNSMNVEFECKDCGEPMFYEES